VVISIGSLLLCYSMRDLLNLTANFFGLIEERIVIYLEINTGTGCVHVCVCVFVHPSLKTKGDL